MERKRSTTPKFQKRQESWKVQETNFKSQEVRIIKKGVTIKVSMGSEMKSWKAVRALVTVLRL
jgi:hypothetical protein